MSTQKGPKMTLKMSTGRNKIPLCFIMRVAMVAMRPWPHPSQGSKIFPSRQIKIFPIKIEKDNLHASEHTWLTWFQQEEEDRREDERRRERQRERERQQRQEQEEEDRRRSAAARQKSREEEQRQRNRKRRNESSSDSDSSRSGHNLSPIVLTNLITLLVYFFWCNKPWWSS